MMEAQKPDRRVERTRKMLRDSLTELILEKDYDKITVQDIIDRANVGRSTFYAHFLDKDDLLIGEMSVFRIDVEEHFGNLGKGIGPLNTKAIFEHVQENYSLYRAMIGTEGIELAKRMAKKKISEHLEDRVNQLSEMGHAVSLPTDVVIQFLTGALLNMMAWWLDNKMPYSPEEMNEMYLKLVMPGLERLASETD